MHETKPYILVVGGANTGRSPMAMALLRRMLHERGLDWRVESAGVIGYDDDPPEPEAYNTMVQFELDISSHRARSLTDDLANSATLLVAIDSSVVHVIRARHPAVVERTVTLSSLASQSRDIPDPYNMLLGAWITYAHEIEDLLHKGVDNLVARVEGAIADAPPLPSPEPDPSPPPSPTSQQQDTHAPPAARAAPLERCERLLAVVRDMPDLVDWNNARRQLETEIRALGQTALHPGDLIESYANMLAAFFSMQATTPTPTHIETLHNALLPLRGAVDQQAITDLSTLMVHWSGSAGDTH